MRYKVTNLDVLEQAETAYDAINKEAAEDAYNKLTEDQKQYVTNPGAITVAREAESDNLLMSNEYILMT